ncbi:type II toxin-antitoxin system VapC family toxin [Pseudoxanthobacter sp. M-2]|uniref:type II toxin-antitoxin system VapC family toxin n=1 Tax=Pseudoxanthobacter sp. M-2 TaxID=3078754 RepID=UPI0038FC357E
MTPYVLDVSLTMGWLFEDEATDAGWQLLDRAIRTGVTVPSIWAYELANVLFVAERRGRVTPAQSSAFLNRLDGLRIDIEATASSHLLAVVLPLARSTGLAIYDAAYVDLAQRLDLPLATKDRRMAEAAANLSIRLLPTA